MPHNTDDPYTYKNSSVLKNKFDIRDFDSLNLIEKQIHAVKAIKDVPKGYFNYKHLQSLHKHLFGDLYEWSGQTRTVNIAKDTDYAGTTMFAMCHRIEPEINKVLDRLLNECAPECNQKQLVTLIAEYFNEVNAIHPFREGNGRANRLFFSELAKSCGFELTGKKWIKKNI